MASPPAPTTSGQAAAADIEIDPAFLPSSSPPNDTDSALGSTSTTDYSTDSLSSTILQYREIHGRTYHNYTGATAQGTEYWAPNDDRANEQLDVNHHLLTLSLDNKLFFAPLESPHEVLDVGTGTGIWAIDFADEFPGAAVTGIDISPIQPTWVPPNVKFVMDDATTEWAYPDETFDYVHIRYMVGCVKDWVGLYREAYRCLKPGGWIEHMDCSVGLWCDDGSIPEGSVFDEWVSMFKKAGPLMGGQSFFVIEGDEFVRGLEEAGFRDVQTRVVKMPVGQWPADRKLKEIGGVNLFSMHKDVEAFALYVLTSILKWEIAEAQVFLAKIRSELKNKAYHGYTLWKAAWSQKPLK